MSEPWDLPSLLTNPSESYTSSQVTPCAVTSTLLFHSLVHWFFTTGPRWKAWEWCLSQLVLGGRHGNGVCHNSFPAEGVGMVFVTAHSRRKAWEWCLSQLIPVWVWGQPLVLYLQNRERDLRLNIALLFH